MIEAFIQLHTFLPDFVTEYGGEGVAAEVIKLYFLGIVSLLCSQIQTLSYNGFQDNCKNCL